MLRRAGLARIARGFAQAVTLTVGVLVGSFLLFNVVPGDPARIVLGPNASEDAVARLRTSLGTDAPLLTQLGMTLLDAAQLRFGESVIDHRSVGNEVLRAFSVTARVAGLASGFALLVSYGLNLLSYVYRRPGLLAFASVGAVAPTYCTGVFAALFFGVLVPVVPLTGYGMGTGSWLLLILPAAVAALQPMASLSEILGSEVRAASVGGYARAAEAFGFSRASVFHRALLPAGAVTWLAAWVNGIAVVFVASFVLEIVFTIPGTGVLLVRSIQEHDFPMLRGLLLVNAVFFVALSWVSESFFSILDPRLRRRAES